ncbi:MAG: leucine--tRNA ligase [Methanobacterium sp.]|nr:leucine--tRNA ligase [Methanobacterium sp.]
MTDIQKEKKWQEEWQNAKLFQSDPDNREKLFITVAYPYPSGAMHIGHGRTYTVPDVYARFKRMQGVNVLFPMGWHVTGAPVIGIAKRIKRKDPWTLSIYKDVHKVPEEELFKFTDPEYIVKYFSTEYHEVMTEMGYSIDWRREFRTTDPHYQKFIEWQFTKLESKGYVRKGVHPVKYCPECQNPVGDHDLLEGEGVAINELTLVKFRIGDDYLVAATFRPETLYGATNLWLNPDAEYLRIKIDKEHWIISKKSYDNLIHQKKDIEIVSEVNPRELIGKYVINPLTNVEHIILPASFVDPGYATGVVYSVPAHAPADFIAHKDLKENQELLSEYHIKEEVEKIKPISIVQLKGFGEFPAEEMILNFNVKDQNDPKLADATNELYKLEHAKGFMYNIPDYNGLKVPIARDEIIKKLLEIKKGDVMYDFAQRPVICRCGTDCVVRILEDQWFLKYSDEKWTELALQCLDNMQIVPEEVRANFQYYLDWLHDWACTRRIGLGTKLPWDKQWIIEPLSDSTIYMAYYAIAKYMKDLKVDDLDESFFDDVFLDKGTYTGKINHELFSNIKEEFNYWYPLDWRLSAKDLVGNHLSFHIFHHSAIFPREKWPQGIVVFGMGLLEGNKMSSSKGNVILLKDAIETYGADVVRLFLMASAEPWQDFDWRENEVKGIKKRLEWFREFIERVKGISDNSVSLKSHEFEKAIKMSINAWILSQVNMRIKDATEALEGFQTRKALQEALFLFKKDIDYYFHRIGKKLEQGEVDPEISKVLVYILNNWIRLMSPFVPHVCEEMWHDLDGDGFVSNAQWPVYDLDLIDEKIQKAEEIIQGLATDINEIKKIIGSDPQKIHIYLAPEWKWNVLELAREVGKPDVGQIMGRSIKNNLHDDKRELADYAKKIAKRMTKINYVGKIDEYSIISDALEFLSKEAGAEVMVYKEPTFDPEDKSGNAMPYKPAIYME